MSRNMCSISTLYPRRSICCGLNLMNNIFHIHEDQLYRERGSIYICIKAVARVDLGNIVSTT